MVLKYLVFHEMLQIYICLEKQKKNVFLCVAYGQYLIYSEHFS